MLTTERPAPRPKPGDGVAFVTGGASGIGLALATALGRRGFSVVLADRDTTALSVAADQLMAEGHDVSTVALDVTDRDAFARAVDQVVDSRGRITYLVNSAGIAIGGATHELSGPHWDQAIDVNLGGVVNSVLAAYPHMVEAGDGHIVNIASGAGLVAPPFVVPYAAAKHAVVGLSLGLRPEAALHGVRVSVVCPGAVETAILDRLPPPDLPATAAPPLTPRAYLDIIGQSPMDADAFAAATLRRIAKNQPVIIVPARDRALWLLHRISPSLTQRLIQRLAAKVQQVLDTRRHTVGNCP